MRRKTFWFKLAISMKILWSGEQYVKMQYHFWHIVIYSYFKCVLSQKKYKRSIKPLFRSLVSSSVSWKKKYYSSISVIWNMLVAAISLRWVLTAVFWSDWAAQKTELEVTLRNHLIHSMALEEEPAIPTIPTPITCCLKALRHWLQHCRISSDGSSWHASRETFFK